MLCSCKNVSKKEVVQFVQENPGITLKELSKKTKAGTGCGKCRPSLRAIIKKYDGSGISIAQADYFR